MTQQAQPREIPASLARYAAELQAGMRAAEYRRAEFEFNYGRSSPRTAQLAAMPAVALEPAPVATTTQDQAQPVVTVPSWPAAVSYYSLMGLQAARRLSYAGGAWRLYVLAKALDRQGLGMISRDELRAYALSLGLDPRQLRRWLNQARTAGLMRDVQSKAGQWLLILPSAGAAAVAMGMTEGVGRKVEIEPAALIGKGWKARVWGGYQATHNGQPITRERMQKIVNVPVATQRYRDNQAGIIRRRNLARYDKPDRLAGELEFSTHKGIFAYRDGAIGWHLPNVYTVPFAQRAGRGRARKANRFIRTAAEQSNGLSLLGQALSCDAEQAGAVIVRLFNRTPEASKATLKRLARTDHHVNEIYQEGETARSGAVLWIPLGGR